MRAGILEGLPLNLSLSHIDVAPTMMRVMTCRAARAAVVAISISACIIRPLGVLASSIGTGIITLCELFANFGYRDITLFEIPSNSRRNGRREGWNRAKCEKKGGVLHSDGKTMEVKLMNERFRGRTAQYIDKNHLNALFMNQSSCRVSPG